MIMRNNQAISIPETCNQPWEQMAAVNYGRHCEHCCKTVIDFTQMSNAEIIGHLATKNNICGRISQTQIDQLNNSLEEKSKRHLKWKRWIVAASIMGLVSFSKAHVKAKVTPIVTETPVKKRYLYHIDTVFKTIKGSIIGDGDTVKMNNTNIYVRGTSIETVTDDEGKFNLKVPINADTLEIAWPPYKRQYVRIDPMNRSEYNIKFITEPDTAWINKHKNDKIMMGGIKGVGKPGQKFNKELLKRSKREIDKTN